MQNSSLSDMKFTKTCTWLCIKLRALPHKNLFCIFVAVTSIKEKQKNISGIHYPEQKISTCTANKQQIYCCSSCQRGLQQKK